MWTSSFIARRRWVRRLLLGSCVGVLPCLGVALPVSALGGPTPSGPVAINGTNALFAVSCPSTSQCTAVDGNPSSTPGGAPSGAPGHELTFNPASPGTPAATTISGGGLVSISCPSSTQCTGVDYGTADEWTFNPASTVPPNPTTIVPIVHSNSFTELESVACPSTTQCTAIDERGTEVTFNPTVPVVTTPVTIDSGVTGQLGGGALYRVACPSTSQCTAIDTLGREVTFNPAAPGNPTPTVISTVQVSDVACPSVSQCTAVSSNPAGGPSYETTFNPASPGTPSPVSIDSSNGIISLACPSATQCTGGGPGVEVTFNPASPDKPTSATVDPVPASGGLARVLKSIACPSTGQCTAVDDFGNEVTFNPIPPPKATGTRLSLSRHTAVTIVGIDTKAKAGAKVLAKLTVSGKVSKKATLTVTASHSFIWKLGKLKRGTYHATFRLAGKVVKTTRIKVT
jgi:hypothetical protein